MLSDHIFLSPVSKDGSGYPEAAISAVICASLTTGPADRS
ncbi:Uncharacterised protein [Mycobacteroides abscessus subsp. abscessus]|nr:Uncharacterised protein [Mycobacteroides abscessus subsp. abscessus]SKO02029.1 Uncharacterised protein [Mycobacteroides abscessus subsp. massiliense]